MHKGLKTVACVVGTGIVILGLALTAWFIGIFIGLMVAYLTMNVCDWYSEFSNTFQYTKDLLSTM